MVELSTKYMGMDLRNPLIVASSGLVNSIEGVEKCAESGAGAVVLKSLFEEQIEADTKELMEHIWLNGHAEAFDYVRGMSMGLGPDDYLRLIEEAKNSVDIPVIASLNCVSAKWWSEFAVKVENAGLQVTSNSKKTVLCKSHYKEWKKETKDVRSLERARFDIY